MSASPGHDASMWYEYEVRLELELRRTSLLRCNFPCNRFLSLQTGPKRESDNKQTKNQKTPPPTLKNKLEKTAAVELLPTNSHATVNVSLLAMLTCSELQC